MPNEQGQSSQFEDFVKQADRGEVILLEGAFCVFHKRRDGQATIHQLLVLKESRQKGLARTILTIIGKKEGVTSLYAKCPADFPSNSFWEHMGFTLVESYRNSNRRTINCWRLGKNGINKLSG